MLHIEVKPLTQTQQCLWGGEGHTASMRGSDRWWVQCNLHKHHVRQQVKDDKPRPESRTLT